MTARIRAAVPEDAALLARLHSASFNEPWTTDSFRRLMERLGAFAFLGANDAATDLQAFILIQVAADESEILSVATLPAARRSGLARALVVRAAGQAARHGAVAMFLEVAEDNRPALALYRACGFADEGRRRNYYVRGDGPAVDALMLSARLPLNKSWE